LQNIDLSPFMKITKDDERVMKELQAAPTNGIPPPPPQPSKAIEELSAKPKSVFSINKYMSGI
jgi:hypothetical protein